LLQLPLAVVQGTVLTPKLRPARRKAGRGSRDSRKPRRDEGGIPDFDLS